MRSDTALRNVIDLLIVTLSLAAGACSSSAPTREAVMTLGVPGQLNENVSAASDGAVVALAWSATSDSAGTNVYAAVSRDGGHSFGNPVRVNALERQANVNGEQPPRIAFVRGRGETPRIVVVWTAKLDDGAVLLSAESLDDGRSFGPSVAVPGAKAAGNRGWESVAADADGRVFAVWLDHRDAVAAGGAAHTAHRHGSSPAGASAVDGAARAQRSQLFVASLDGSVTPTSVARGVCYCCKTAVLAGADGAVYAAWRHVYPGNRRDIAFAVSRDSGRSFAAPVRVSEDNWQIDGCPENGPSLAMDRNRRIHVLWPTLVAGADGERLELFLASTADGVTFTPRSLLPAGGAAFHAQLAAGTDGTLIAAWEEASSGSPRRVRVARGRSDDAGIVKFEALDLTGGDAGAYPALAAASDNVVLAWTARAGSESWIKVRPIPNQ